jgi:hypothetical protein
MTTIETTTTTRRRARRAGTVLALALCALAASAAVAQAAASFSWSAPAVADSSSTHTTAISCPSTGLCVAVDAGGNVVYTVTPASGGWSAPLSVDSGHQLTAISCPTTSLCFAADNHGDIYSSTAPTSAAGWTTSGDVDGTTPITGISCPSAALCVAVDATGHVLGSTSPGTLTAGAWPVVDTDGSNPLTGVSCPSTSLCAAVDNAGQVLVTTTPPTGWAAALSLSSTTGLTAVSCTASGLCVATGNDGTVYASADANASNPTWSRTAVDSTALNAVSCSDVGVCVLADEGGSVLVSDTPASAPPNWAVAPIDAGQALSGVSCLSAGLCVAVDTPGHALAGTLAAPSVTTGTGSVGSQTTGTLSGTVNPNDATLSDCHFDYGTTTAYGSSVPCTVVPSATGGAQGVVAQLSGLNASTTYHFRVVASSGVATNDGGDASFTTPAPLKPSPSLSGTAAVGETLTCKTNVTTTSTETVAYQWLSDTAPIAGATGATYVIAPTDASHHLSCQVTISGDGGSAVATSVFDAVPSQTAGKIVESSVGSDKHSANSVSVPVTCSPQAAGSCKITLTLTTVVTAHHRSQTIKVGSASTTLGAGSKKTLSVSLNATGKRMLRNRHTLKVTLTVRGTILGVLTATLKTDKVTFGGSGNTTKHPKRHATRHRR